jgi:DNA-binding phage protein
MQIESVEQIVAILEEARVAKGVSVRGVATTTGRTPGVYHKWRKVQHPGIESLLAFAKAVGLQVHIY